MIPSVWADRFDGKLTDILSVESEVAKASPTNTSTGNGRGKKRSSRREPKIRQDNPEVTMLYLVFLHYT